MAARIVELNIDDSDREEIETLQSLVITWKTTLTGLKGEDSKPDEGLLKAKLETL